MANIKSSLSVATVAAILSVCALGQQASSFPGTVYTAASGNLVRTVPNAPVVFCNYPATGGAPCTNLAATFSSLLGNSACAAGQGVLPTTTTCSSTADSQGNFVLYAAAGNYAYYFQVNGAWYGPFAVALGGVGSGTIVGATSNGGLVLTGNTIGLLQTCVNGQVEQWNGTQWVCATVAGTGTITGVTTAAGSGLIGGGSVGTLNIQLTNICSTGQVLQYNGATWVCAAGTGNINNAAQFSLAMYSVAGSNNTVSGVSAPSSPNGVPQTPTSTPASGVPSSFVMSLPGLGGRAVTGVTNTDLISSADCNPARITYKSSVAVSVVLPTAATLAVPSCAFRIVNNTTGTNTDVTVTPSTWTCNGGASCPIHQGQIATFSVDPNSATNWSADITEQGFTFGAGLTATRSATGVSVVSSGGGGGSGTVSANNGTAGAIANYAAAGGSTTVTADANLFDSGGVWNVGEGWVFTGASGAATTISTSTTNANLFLTPNGTGAVVFNNGTKGNPSMVFGSALTTGFHWQSSTAACFSGGGTDLECFSGQNFEIGDSGAFIFSQTSQASGTQGPSLGAVGSGATMTLQASTTIQYPKCKVTSAIVLSGSPTNICAWTLPNAAGLTWAWQCTGSYTITAGTTPNFQIGMNASTAPTSETGDADIYSTLTGTHTQSGPITSTSSGNQNILTGTNVTTVTGASWRSWGTIQAASATGTFAITGALGGTTPAGTVNTDTNCILF